MAINELKSSEPGKDPYQQERQELACAFRWLARLDMHEGVANHFSLAVSDDGTDFLINSAGRHFSRIRASELLLIHAHDKSVLEQDNAPDPTAWGLHGALHRNCPQARCILHAHPTYATVLASLADSRMLPIDQNAARFFDRVVIDEEYSGLAFEAEGERCSKLLGDKRIMVMGNHGLLVVGPSVAMAFDDLYHFERAARNLVLAYATNKELKILSDEIAEKTAQQTETQNEVLVDQHFDALQTILDEEEPDYRL